MPIANGTYYIVNKGSALYITAASVKGGTITAEVVGPQPNYTRRWQISVKDAAAESYWVKAVDPEFYAFAQSPSFSGQTVNSGEDTQAWIITSAGSGFYSIGKPSTDLVWQFVSNDAESSLTLGPNVGGDTQKWSFKSAN